MAIEFLAGLVAWMLSGVTAGLFLCDGHGGRDRFTYLVLGVLAGPPLWFLVSSEMVKKAR